MVEANAKLNEFQGFTFRELRERFPEQHQELVALILDRRSQGRCDLCGGPLGEGATHDPAAAPLAPKIVGHSRCGAC